MHRPNGESDTQAVPNDLRTRISQDGALADDQPLELAGSDLSVNPLSSARVPRPRGRVIHELFEEQVERTPDALAVVYGDRRLIYSDINEKANQLARRLVDHGVGPGKLVAICVDRSPEMVVGLLSIMKAGGAYVPLDPNYPTERLQYMLNDSEPLVVMTHEKLRPVLTASIMNVVELDVELARSGSHSPENLDDNDLQSCEHDLVYVIYTSGSTGTPKGIEMPHRSMVNLIEWHRQNLTAAEGCRVLQFAPLSFDVAFQEIFSTLCTGGTLVLPDEWVRHDYAALLDLLDTRAIERLFLPPVVLHRICESANSAGRTPTNLKDVVVAGEQLRINTSISTFFRRLNGCRLHNHYGPTETHVVTALTLAEDPSEWPLLPSIGRPISNTEIHILNTHRAVVPSGEVGEIYIGGDCVARGYLKRPDLTTERFVIDSFSGEKTSRMYKTGDLGRWCDDGTLEYMGRNDFQIKIRGFRVEPGEIEAALESCDGVKRAVVIAREDNPGEKRLAAYVVMDRLDDLEPVLDADGPEGMQPHGRISELRAFLKERLPQFMVPASIVVLSDLPVSPNGKIDRSKLPALDNNRPLDQAYVPPVSPIEVALSDIWAEILKIDQVGIDDNFFELGGDSLLGLDLVTKVSEKLNIRDLSIVAIFEAPTVREMAHFIDALLDAATAHSPVSLVM